MKNIAMTVSLRRFHLAARERLLQQKEFFVGFLILLGVVLLNTFPAGYTILGGDVYQYIDLKQHFLFYHTMWFGRASLFYGIFYFLDVLGISNTGQLSWYLGIFLIGAYTSFFIFSRLVISGLAKLISCVTALFYATNIYTLFIFAQPWGFTPFMMLYIFIPILTGLYIKVLTVVDAAPYLLLFTTTMFFASVSFINPAFALVLVIYFVFLTLFLRLLQFFEFTAKNNKKLLILFFGSVILNVYWILPLLPQVQPGIGSLESSQVVNLQERLLKTSNTIFDTVRFLPTSEQRSYFPVNFPYHFLLWARGAIIVLSFIPFFLILAGFFKQNSDRQKKLLLVFVSMLTVFIVLVARVHPPFDGLNRFLFNLPGLSVLRGYDKLSIVVPFIVTASLLAAMFLYQDKRYFKYFLALFFTLTVILALPFYLGGVQTKMGYLLKGQKNYLNADYSSLRKIPEEYRSIRGIVDAEKDDTKLSLLPFSPGSSIGRTNLPKWGVNAVHFAPSLYQRDYFELNEYALPKWMFGQEFGSTAYDPEWIPDILGLFGVKYIIYHKDAKPNALKDFEQNKALLEERGILQPLVDNSYFTLYTLPNQKVFPYVYAVENPFSIGTQVVGLAQKIETQKKSLSELLYEKSGGRVLVTVPELSEKKRLILNEVNSPLWEARYRSDAGKETVLKRDHSILYGNAWKLDKGLAAGTVEIYQTPLPLMYTGMAISSGGLLVLCLLWILFIKEKKYAY